MKKNDMKQMFLALGLMMAAFLGAPTSALSQTQDKEPTTEELASKEAERLASLLKLEDWQIFYVDSTLQHDFGCLKEEIAKLRTAKVENYDLYSVTRDKWMEQIEATYKKYFTPQQWAAWLKNGGAKEQKARAKRKAARGNVK